MYIIIVGGGETGSTLAKRLVEREHEPVIIEENEERAQELAGNLDALVIQGSGGNIDVMKDAGAEKADAMVAVAGSDETNFIACKLAKRLEIKRVVTRINDRKLTPIFEDLGVNAAISFVDAAVTLYEKAVTGEQMYGLLSMGGTETEVVEVSVNKKSKAVGETIENLNLPDLCTVAMITRDGSLIPPRGDTQFKKNDKVILVGKTEDVMSVAKKFREK